MTLLEQNNKHLQHLTFSLFLFFYLFFPPHNSPLIDLIVKSNVIVKSTLLSSLTSSFQPSLATIFFRLVSQMWTFLPSSVSWPLLTLYLSPWWSSSPTPATRGHFLIDTFSLGGAHQSTRLLAQVIVVSEWWNRGSSTKTKWPVSLARAQLLYQVGG